MHVVANLLTLSAFACLAIAFSTRFSWMVPGFLLVAVATFVLTDTVQRARDKREPPATAVEQEEPSDAD
ncbi:MULTISPECIES: hypothetical protein [Bacteria]|uniref:hypothetical protein n=1 Tax=Bacteria TaxID=2 RepID=UPI0018CE345B